MMGDMVIATVIVVFSFMLLGESAKYNYYSAVFPRFVLFLLIAFSVSLIVRSVILSRKLRTTQKKLIPISNFLYVTFAAIWSFVWIYMMDWVLGFAVGSIAFGVSMFLVLAGKTLSVKEKIFMSIVYSGIVLVFWFALGKLLHVPFPTGLLF